MLGLNGSFFVGLSGIRSANAGLWITGNNIANVNTHGYSRQTADLATKGTLRQGTIVVGTGSEVRTIMAARDRLVNATVVEENTRYHFFEEMAGLLGSVEAYLSDSSDGGINEAYVAFMESLNAANVRPESSAVRREMLATGSFLASEVRNTYRQVLEAGNTINLEIPDVVDEVNRLADEIADLNGEIGSKPDVPQDLIDRRQSAIERLSELVQVEVYELDSNVVQVNLSGSTYLLVGRNRAYDLDVQLNAANFNYYDITLDVGGGVQQIITADLNDGILGAKLRVRDVEIPAVRRSLDNFAAGLIQQFNAIHQTGYALDGVTTGLNFFDPFVSGAPGLDNNLGAAANMRLSTDVNGLPENIALSGTGAVGDNGVGLAMAALRFNPAVIDSDGDNVPDTGSFEDYHNSMVTGLGALVYTVEQQRYAQGLVVEQAKQRKDEISGVSLDEEAANLTQYQRAFEASSRFLNVIDQLTAEIINSLG